MNQNIITITSDNVTITISTSGSAKPVVSTNSVGLPVPAVEKLPAKASGVKINSPIGPIEHWSTTNNFYTLGLVKALEVAGIIGLTKNNLRNISEGYAVSNKRFNSWLRYYTNCVCSDNPRRVVRLPNGNYALAKYFGAETQAYATLAHTTKIPVKNIKPGLVAITKTLKSRHLGPEITACLFSAGSKGAKVASLAETLDVPYSRVKMWFKTTGRKNKQIVQTAPATYVLKS